MPSAWVGVTCPCCGYEIDVLYDPGLPAVYYPNDKAHPGDPPSIASVRGCDCWDYLGRYIGAEEEYEERLIELVGEESDG